MYKTGNNFKIGNYNIIEDDVIVGDNVEICNYVLLKNGTRIGDDCYIDSYVLSSGNNIIGNNVKIRYQSILARNLIIKDDVYICAGVKTIYLNHSGLSSDKPLVIDNGCFIGDNVTICGSVHIRKNCIIGANTLITKDTEENGVYVGSPGKRIRDIKKDELWWRKS